MPIVVFGVCKMPSPGKPLKLDCAKAWLRRVQENIAPGGGCGCSARHYLLSQSARGVLHATRRTPLRAYRPKAGVTKVRGNVILHKQRQRKIAVLARCFARPQSEHELAHQPNKSLRDQRRILCSSVGVCAQQLGMRGGQEPALGRTQINRDKDGFLAVLIA